MAPLTWYGRNGHRYCYNKLFKTVNVVLLFNLSGAEASMFRVNHTNIMNIDVLILALPGPQWSWY